MDITRELCRFGHQEVSGKAAYCLSDSSFFSSEFDGFVLKEQSRCAFPFTKLFFFSKVPERKI